MRIVNVRLAVTVFGKLMVRHQREDRGRGGWEMYGRVRRRKQDSK